MFKFIKDKLKDAVDKISEKIAEEAPEEVAEEKKVEEKPKEKKKKEPKKEKPKKKPKVEESVKEEPTEEKGFFTKVKEKLTKEEPEEKESILTKLKTKVTTKKVTQDLFQEIFWELELVLLESNVAIEVIEKIKEDLQKNIVDKQIKRAEIEQTIQDTLRESIDEILTQEPIDLLKQAKTKKPYVICFVGINGTGKTTSIGKVAQYLKDNNLSSIMIAADTFRAAAIEQLEEWGKRTKTKVIKHDYGSDAAAVAFDGIKHAKAKDIDVVLIDTAGRLHSNTDLMNELHKIIKIATPDLKIFVGEATTGNDCVEQIKEFNEKVNIDGIILTKLDVDEKGGAALSTSYVTKKPIIFVGTGQNAKDLQPFDKKTMIKNLGFD